MPGAYAQVVQATERACANAVQGSNISHPMSESDAEEGTWNSGASESVEKGGVSRLGGEPDMSGREFNLNVTF